MRRALIVICTAALVVASWNSAAQCGPRRTMRSHYNGYGMTGLAGYCYPGWLHSRLVDGFDGVAPQSGEYRGYGTYAPICLGAPYLPCDGMCESCEPQPVVDEPYYTGQAPKSFFIREAKRTPAAANPR